MRSPLEWDPLEGVLLTTWTSSYDDSFVPLTRALLDTGTTVFVCSREDEQANLNAHAWLDGEDGVVWLDCGVDTIWVRDWGPFFLEDEELGRVLGDSSYQAVRPNDNGYPTDAGADHFDAPVHRIPMRLDGGNVLALEDGRCLSSTTVHTRHPDFEADDAIALMDEGLGCTDVLFLDPIEGEPTGHVDFHALPLPGGRVVSAVPQNDDRLIDAGLEVLPADLPDSTLFETWQNAIWVEDTLLVPTYDGLDNEGALDQLQGWLPDTELVPVPSDALIASGGAIHCVVKQVFTAPEIPPVPRDPKVDPEPRYACSSAVPPERGWAWVLALVALSTWRGRRPTHARRS